MSKEGRLLFLTTDFEVLWTAKILIPMENLMHLTSPLSSILRRREKNIPPSGATEARRRCGRRIRYLKATLLLSSGPLATTPVAPPERTANTYGQKTSASVR